MRAGYPLWRKARLRLGAIALGVLFCSLSSRSVFGLDSQKKPRHYVRSIYDESSGLPQASVLAITQTPDGYYWLGTQEGLARFDGVDFEVFDSKNTPELTHDDVTQLYFDRSGRLWIGTRGGGVVSYARGRFKRLGKKDGLVDENVLDVFEDSKGRIWFGTNEGCTVMEPGGDLWKLTAEEGLPRGAVNDIVEDKSKDIWIATEGGLVRRRGESLSVYDSRTAPELGVDSIRALAIDSAEALWIGTWGDGLVLYAGGRFEKIPSDQPKQMILDIVEDRDKNIWVALYDKGLGRVEGGRLKSYGKGDGLPTENGLAVFEDREGNLLVGLGPGGLVVLRDAPFTTFDGRDGLPDPSIRTIYEDSTGDMWIGLQSDGLGRMRDGVFELFGAEEGIEGGTRTILERPEGGLYVATLKAGVVVFEDGRVTGTLAREGKAAESSVRTMLRASDGSTWFGAMGQGLFHKKGDELVSYSTADGLGSDRVLALAEGPDGTLWIGTWGGGLTRYRQGRFEVIDGPKELESQAVTALKVDPDGTVWVGTYGFGILCYKDGRFSHIRRADGLPDDSVYVFLEHDGDIWATGNRGIFRVPKKELLDFVAGRVEGVRTESFGEKDGLKSRECNGGAQPAGWKSRDGRLWFPTIAGLAVVDPDDVVRNEFVPSALTTRFVVDGVDLPVGQNMSIGPGVEKLEIHYTAPTLTSPEEVTFRFRLKGFERDWVDVGDRRVAYYTNLAPGSYRFEVIPVNADGVVKDAAHLSFDIVPAVWQTLWFKILALLAGLALVWGLVLLKLRSIRRQNVLLEEKVAQRTQDLEKAHARIVKLEKESIEKQMAGGFAHEIRNALAGAKLLVLRVLRAAGPDNQAESLNRLNSRRLTELFVMLRSKLDKESLIEAAEIIKKINADEQRMEQVLTRALVSVERSLSVTQLIMEYSKIGGQRPGTRKIKLHGVMIQILEEHRSRIENLGIEVELGVSEDTVIRCDDAHLFAVFGNLVANAVDALEGSDSTAMEKRLQIRETRDPGRLIVEVSDTGPGISETEQKKIFEPFYTTKPDTGTGLGLGMAAKYLSLYNGYLDVSSQPGVGTRFSVIFPETPDPDEPGEFGEGLRDGI